MHGASARAADFAAPCGGWRDRRHALSVADRPLGSPPPPPVDILAWAVDLACMPTLLQVALGGALGASLRWGVGLGVLRLVGPGFPVATLAINVLGSLLMGAFAMLAARRGMSHLAPFAMTGVLGGFTTFSAFSLETVTLLERGRVGAAASYVALSVGLSIGALMLGAALARWLA